MLGFSDPPSPNFECVSYKPFPQYNYPRKRALNLNLLIRIFIGRNMILGDAIAI